MKRLLFALGVLMMLIGGSCIFSGYPIVEVERGWTLTICGATAMTGGAIVIALGFFLIRLETLATGLRGAFAGAIAVAPAPVAASFDAEFSRSQSSRSQSSRSQSPVSQSSASQPPAPPPPAPFPPSRPAPAPVSSPAPPPAEFAPPERLSPRRTPDFLKVRREEAGARSQVESAEAAWARPSEPAPVREPPPPPEAAAPASLEPPPPAPAPAAPVRTPPVETVQDAAPPREDAPPEPLFRRFPVRSLTLPRGAWPEAPSTIGARQALAVAPVATQAATPVMPKAEARLAEPLPAAPVVPVALDGRPRAEAPPAIGAEAEAWFERALAGLDEDIAPRTAVAPKPEASSEHVASVEPAEQAESVKSDAGVGGGEAVAPAAESPPSEPQAPAVIGRYETEGTLYVMYADGSIEAQTATGVYRFKSLTALKAHIESLN